jgi:hypothetical protein
MFQLQSTDVHDPRSVVGGLMRYFPTPGTDIVQNRTLARPEGFEPPTPRFVVCSHLFSAVSYHTKLYDGRSRSTLFC